jgi:hypothetical protein
MTGRSIDGIRGTSEVGDWPACLFAQPATSPTTSAQNAITIRMSGTLSPAGGEGSRLAWSGDHIAGAVVRSFTNRCQRGRHACTGERPLGPAVR